MTSLSLEHDFANSKRKSEELAHSSPKNETLKKNTIHPQTLTNTIRLGYKMPITTIGP